LVTKSNRDSSRLSRVNKVAFVGSLIGLLSPFFGWLTLKPNRLATGTSLSLWNSLGWEIAVTTILLWITILVLSLSDGKKWQPFAFAALANIILIMTSIAAGSAAAGLISKSSDLTRVSLSSGILISAVGALIILISARHQVAQNRLEMNLIVWPWLAILLIFLLSGWFNHLSILQEYFNNSSRLRQELLTHITLFSGSIMAGILIGIPLGIWAARSNRANRPIFFLANITQTIPSLALFGLMLVPLSALSTAFPFLQSLGISGIGAAPAFIALIIYALLPIIQNTYTGLRQINPAVIDAGRGMGMNRAQLLRRVEAPLAAPLILVGVRTAAVQTVGNTAVAALIGAGGLGQFIFQGLGQAAADLIILGAIPIIVLALIVDLAMLIIIRIVTPRGLTEAPA